MNNDKTMDNDKSNNSMNKNNDEKDKYNKHKVIKTKCVKEFMYIYIS